jgi:hypothetical protein
MPREALSYIGWLAASVACGYVMLRLFWRVLGAYKVRRAGPRPLSAARHVLWRDPGLVERLDLISGPGGRNCIPVPPYRFLEEHVTGSQPCVSVTDGRGRRWRVKWGQEVRCETFAVRLAWACGYFAEITHFVPSGRIDGVGPLARAAESVDASGAFVDARFELDDPAVEKLFEEHSWSWTDNPFAGTRELAGLKVLLMLISNWDNKDQRDVARGSNTAIYVTRASRWRREAQYLIVDWGGSMGRWGRAVVTRGRWDPEGFAAQTPQFVTGVAGGGFVQFGYTGQRTGDARANIRVEDVAWLCRYLGRVTDAQLRAALHASGATDEEAASFTRSLRARIDQLIIVAASPAPSAAPSTDPPARDAADTARAALS